MKRYWQTRGGMIEEDNGGYMLSCEVLPELDRLNNRIAELEREILRKSVKEWASKDKEKIDALEARITELEAAAKTECDRQKEQITELYSREDKLKTELTEERLKTFAPLLPSEMCSKHHVQNCHICDRLDCGDNTSEAKKRIAELEAESTKLKEENILARCHIRGMKERISELEAANKKITELADKVTLENLTLYGKIRVLTARISELEAALKRIVQADAGYNADKGYQYPAECMERMTKIATYALQQPPTVTPMPGKESR